MGERKCAYRELMGEPEGKRTLGRRRRRWTTLKWILKKYDGEKLDWICVSQGWDKFRAVVNTVMNLQVPQKGVSQLTS